MADVDVTKLSKEDYAKIFNSVKNDLLGAGTVSGQAAPPTSPVVSALPVAAPVPQSTAISALPVATLPQPTTVGNQPTAAAAAAATPALGISPAQYQRDLLTDITKRGGLKSEEAQQDIETEQKKADVLAARQAEQNQQLQDFQTAHANAMQDITNMSNQHQTAYNDWKFATKDVKDPAEQFWGNKSVGQKILSSVALFASGLGAGIQKKGGNPVLDMIQHEIDKNYEAHKDHIDDLYKQQVESGKMADTAQNKAKFDEDARLRYYDLAGNKVKDDLAYIAQNSASGAAKLVAKQTILDTAKKQEDLQNQYAIKQAQSAAAQLAQQRANQKDVREKFFSLLDKYKDYAPDEARARAFDDLQGLGFDRSHLAPLAQGLGIPYNGQTDKFDTKLQVIPGASYDTNKKEWKIPGSESIGSSLPMEGAVFDPNEGPNGTWRVPGKSGVLPLMYKPTSPSNTGQNIIPTVDDQGRIIKPEEREKLRQLIVNLPDGSQRLANSPEDVKHVEQQINAGQKVQDFNKLLGGDNGLIAKYRNGTLTNEEVGQWQASRQAAIDSFKAAASGAEGLTGKGMATMLSEEAFPEPPNVIANSIRITGGTYSSVMYGPAYEGQIKSLNKFVQENNQSIERRLRPLPKGAKQPIEQEQEQEQTKPANKQIYGIPVR